MVKRKIIEIDEEKCNGCGLCIPNCPEGALQIINGKARLVGDLFCDGLGACIGACPRGAIKIIEREAEPYDERKVMERMVKQGKEVIKAHLLHLKEHGEHEYLKEAINFLKERGIKNPLEEEDTHQFHACPGTRVIDRSKESLSFDSELRQWPIQLMLVPSNAPFFTGRNLLIVADCVPFAYANFHGEFLRGKSLVIGCPKLDDTEFYREKLTEIFRNNDIKSVTVIHMEVPCCYGLMHLVKEALNDSGKKIEVKEIVVGIDGRVKS